MRVVLLVLLLLVLLVVTGVKQSQLLVLRLSLEFDKKLFIVLICVKCLIQPLFVTIRDNHTL